MNESYIYIIFVKTNTLLSRSIGAITKSAYTHVALSLDDNFKNLYTFGRLRPSNPFFAGLTVENFHTGVYQRSPYCPSLIYKIAVSEEQLKKLTKELDKYYSSDIKYRYNFLGLFAVLMDKQWKREHHYFCSEFVTELLASSDIWHSPKAPELTKPSDLIHINNKEIFYKGYTADFSSKYKYKNISLK